MNTTTTLSVRVQALRISLAVSKDQLTYAQWREALTETKALCEEDSFLQEWQRDQNLLMLCRDLFTHGANSLERQLKHLELAEVEEAHRAYLTENSDRNIELYDFFIRRSQWGEWLATMLSEVDPTNRYRIRQLDDQMRSQIIPHFRWALVHFNVMVNTLSVWRQDVYMENLAMCQFPEKTPGSSYYEHQRALFIQRMLGAVDAIRYSKAP